MNLTKVLKGGVFGVVDWWFMASKTTPKKRPLKRRQKFPPKIAFEGVFFVEHPYKGRIPDRGTEPHLTNNGEQK